MYCHPEPPVDGVEQFFMLAASPGELAANLLHEKTGAFSKALMEELEKQEASWPPEMSRLNSQLMERFTMLRDSGKAGQTPSHFWYREWNGSEGTIGSFKRHSPAKAVAQIPLSNEDRDELVLALLELEAMASREERENVIKDLRQEIKFNIPYSNKDRFHVDNLVKTALNYPGGLQEVIRVVNRFKGADEIAWQKLKVILDKLNIVID
ncbi:MAG: hypothetical protein IPJ07_14410 [Acidobacteria bacterium]|nr:hypothetical protein [Acidobacteriota bacterium]